MQTTMGDRIDMSDRTERKAPLAVDDDTMLAVLDDAVAAIRETGTPFLMIGGIASTVWGRDRGTTDIDVFVRPEGVDVTLDALERKGIETSVEFEHWLSKGRRDGVTVDVIYRATRDILIDDEMLLRSTEQSFRGRRLPIAPAEDVVVMKASAAAEDTARYWHDALGILARADLDWDYLAARARQHAARRVLSLLLFATSVDLVVPPGPLERLWAAVHEGSPVDG